VEFIKGEDGVEFIIRFYEDLLLGPTVFQKKWQLVGVAWFSCVQVTHRRTTDSSRLSGIMQMETHE
jgi:hypothetical protein